MEYVYKGGVKLQRYDAYNGPYMRYKEDSQDYDLAAKKDTPDEPLCKGRNQVIIVADKRVPGSQQSGNLSPINQTQFQLKRLRF